MMRKTKFSQNQEKLNRKLLESHNSQLIAIMVSVSLKPLMLLSRTHRKKLTKPLTTLLPCYMI